MRRLAVISATLLALCLASETAAAARRVALVIGNSGYQNVAALTNPSNDAAAIADMFKKAAFDVVDFRRDLNYLDMRRALRDFTDKARGAEIAVIYFAGHGLEVDGTNYIVPVDAVLERDSDVEDEAVSLNRMLFSVEPATHLRLVILDACRDNPFAKKMKRTLAVRAGAVSRGLVSVEATRPNTFIAFAAKEGATAADGDGANSPFTTALLKHLTLPGLDIRKAFGYVRDDVMSATGDQQEPYTTNSLGGSDVALVPVLAAPQSAVVTGSANADARVDYQLAERVGTKEAWDSFIAAHPSGFYTELAKAARNKLAVDNEKTLRPEASKPIGAEPAKAAEVPPSAARLAEPAVAALAPPAAAIEPAKPAQPLPEVTTRLLQTELRRVGCKTSATDGEWDASDRRALALFNDNAGTKFDVKVASVDALDAVHAHTGRVCPLDCERGFRASGDHCVKIVCDEGQVLTASGTCQPRPERAPKPAVARQRAPATHGRCFVYNGASVCE